MDQEGLLEEIFGIVAVLADEIYFRKCMFYNVSELSKAEEDACIQEAVEVLPAFMKTFSECSKALKEMEASKQEQTFCKCGCSENPADWRSDGRA